MTDRTIKISLARKTADLKRILALQTANLPEALGDAEQAAEGFVSARHSLPTLQAMNQAAAAVMAKDGTTLAGYALAMTRAFSAAVPLLAGIFEYQDQLVYQGKTLGEQGYIVMGQVCVASDYRGQRLVDRMYRYFRGCYALHYPFLLTAISPRNTRSRRVHQRCGFQEIAIYKGPDGQEWVIVLWDWR